MMPKSRREIQRMRWINRTNAIFSAFILFFAVRCFWCDGAFMYVFELLHTMWVYMFSQHDNQITINGKVNLLPCRSSILRLYLTFADISFDFLCVTFDANAFPVIVYLDIRCSYYEVHIVADATVLLLLLMMMLLVFQHLWNNFFPTHIAHTHVMHRMVQKCLYNSCSQQDNFLSRTMWLTFFPKMRCIQKNLNDFREISSLESPTRERVLWAGDHRVSFYDFFYAASSCEYSDGGWKMRAYTVCSQYIESSQSSQYRYVRTDRM